MTDRLGFVSLGMLVAPLSFFYFYYLAWTVRSGAILSSSAVGGLVLGTMILRLAAVSAHPRLRRAKASIVVDIFSVEVLVAATLVVFLLVIGVHAFPAFVTEVALAWLPAVLLVLPPYALYRLAVALLENSRLSTIVPLAVGLFSVLVVPAEVATLSQSVAGLSGISRLLLEVFLGQARNEFLVPVVTVAGLLLFIALVLHVVSREEVGQGRLSLLLVAVLGSLATLAWSLLGSILTDNTLLLFAVPGLTLIGIIWWGTRGR